MDSFVLSETFKYLYLLFSKPEELPINLNEFVFTTEAHLLPLSLAGKNLTSFHGGPSRIESDETRGESSKEDLEFWQTCPNAHSLFPGKHKFAENIRKRLKNYVDTVCPNKHHRSMLTRKLRAADFQNGNEAHVQILRDMGITLLGLPDGKVQLLHTSTTAKSREDSDEGLLFMQEMIELSKLQQDQPDHPPKAVIYAMPVPSTKRTVKTTTAATSNTASIPTSRESSSVDHADNSTATPENVLENHEIDSIIISTLLAGPAQFGLQLKDDVTVEGSLVIASPYRACDTLDNAEEVRGKIVLVERGDCMFIDKARVIQKLGAIGGIVVDNSESATATPQPPVSPDGDSASSTGSIDDTSSPETPPMFAMSGDNSSDDVTIPLVFLFKGPASQLLEVHKQAMEANTEFSVMLSDYKQSSKATSKSNLKDFIVTVVNEDTPQPEEKVSSTVQALLRNKQKVIRQQKPSADSVQKKSAEDDATCDGDDLVTLVQDGTEKKPEKTFDPTKKTIGDVILEQSENDIIDAWTADETLVSLKHFVTLAKSKYDGDTLIKRLQHLLAKKAPREPDIIRSLLSTHLTDFASLLELASKTSNPPPKQLDNAASAKLVDNVVHGLIEVLVSSIVRESKNEQRTKDLTHKFKNLLTGDFTYNSADTSDRKKLGKSMSLEKLLDEEDPYDADTIEKIASKYLTSTSAINIFSKDEDVDTESDDEENLIETGEQRVADDVKERNANDGLQSLPETGENDATDSNAASPLTSTTSTNQQEDLRNDVGQHNSAIDDDSIIKLSDLAENALESNSIEAKQEETVTSKGMLQDETVVANAEASTSVDTTKEEL